MMVPHLFEQLPEELAPLLDTSLSHARRIVAHVVGRGARELESLPRIAPRVRAAIEERTRRDRLEVIERVEDRSDGFVKFLLRSPDAALTEAVRIPLHAPGRYSLCLSSQVGCAMGCVFCATGRLGLSRNLAAWEMVGAFLAVRDDLESQPGGGRITSAVFMGQGEPFHNYDAVIRAAKMLSHPCGGRIAAKSITISTVGLVPQIRRYTREGHRHRLVVSLTSAVADKRRRLLPVAGKLALSDLAEALREHAAATGDLVTIAWVVMGGVNTGADEIAALRELVAGIPVIVNVIDVNDATGTFRRAGPEELAGFRDALRAVGAPSRRRYSGGASRHAACGMLRAERHESH